jgi:fructose-bisphosphate aldolase class 1
MLGPPREGSETEQLSRTAYKDIRTFRRSSSRCSWKYTGPVPGIAFLSGGQSDEEATAHLDAMNRLGGLP